MHAKVIFTFWEPRGKILPYLELCKKTWEINLSEYEVIVLDYSNIHDYLSGGVYDLSIVKRLPLFMQKDAIMIAVLQEHGGIFMDMDTLALKDILPIVRRLRKTQIVMFNNHLAFVAAREDSYIFTLWVEKVQQRLAEFKKNATTYPRWDYVGNSVLTEIMEEMTNNLAIMAPTKVIERCLQICQRIAKWRVFSVPRFIQVLNRIHNAFLYERRRLVFNTLYKKYLSMLDRRKYGYIPEVVYYKTQSMDEREKYLKFWFESDIDVATVFQKNQTLIGLHNTRTPEWYQRLSQQEVLENTCLLSRTLNYILKL